jgi:aryl-alcohol dehydrogenase-like predicted oxidoreductase
MTPRYLEDQMNRSLANLGLETIDLYYVHNPETQLEEVGAEEFYARLARTFELLEKKVSEGKIKMYGAATWNGYRMAARSHDYLSLEHVLEAARQAGGASHHFKAIQLPYNLGMPEAFVSQNQIWEGERVSAIEWARRAGLLVFTSASLLQGRLAQRGVRNALQFVRSTPGVTSALVGMKTLEHVSENLAVSSIPPLSETEFTNLFVKKS